MGADEAGHLAWAEPGRHRAAPEHDESSLPGPSAAGRGAVVSVWELNCARCGGRGTVPDPQWQAWQQRRRDLEDRLTGAEPVETSVIRDQLAQHLCRVPPGARRHPCRACVGTGRIPTPDGIALLDFLARHARRR